MKIRWSLLSLLLLLALPAAVQAQFTFTTNNGAITITGYTGIPTVLTIPSTTNGYPVTSIGVSAFTGSNSITSVLIPASITNIGNWSFEYCANLVSIFCLGNAPTNSAMYAFFGDNKATLYYLSGTTGWGSYFDGVSTKMVNETNPVVTITAPVNGQSWSNGVFTMTGTAHGSVPLSGVWFQVNSNGWQLAATSNKWTNWTATASLMVGSNWLQAYTVDGYGSNSTNASASLNCISLFTFTTNNGKIIITGYTGPDGAVSIPNIINGLPVVSIADSAFNGDGNITSVTIPYGITNIGNAAFQSCTGLTNINIPNSITGIGNDAFSGTALMTVMIGTNVASIGDDAFNGCSGLASIYFEGNAPANVGSNVFLNDNNVAIYYLPGTTGWNSTFAGLPTIEVNENAAITFPVNGQRLSSGVFTMTGTASGSVPVSGVWFQINSNGWHLAATTNNWTNWTVAASLIAPGVISGTNLLQVYAGDGFGDVSAIAPVDFIFVCDFNYTYQSGVITITGYTGSGGAVIIPGTINGFPVTAIGANAFLLCSTATSITVPNSVTSIGNAAFDYCPTSIYFNGNAPAISGDAFYADTTATTIYYRTGTSGWSSGGWPAAFATVSGSGVAVNESNPTLAITSPVSGQSVTSSGFSVTGNANGKVPVLGVRFQVNSNGWQLASTANNWTNWTAAASLVAPGMIPGTNALQAYAVDAFGNNSTNATVNNLLWPPQVQMSDGSFGIQTNQFGFNINWASGAVVVVEACTNLASPIWSPVATNTLSGGTSYFSDLQWTNYPGRFYRLRSP